MEKRALLAALLCVIILLAYQEYLKRYYPPKPLPPAVSESQPAPTPASEPAPPQRVPEPAAPETADLGREVEIRTPLYRAVLTTKGGRFESFTLARYRSRVEQGSPPVEMVQAEGGIPLPGALTVHRTNGAVEDGGIYYETDRTSLTLEPGHTEKLVLRGRAATGEVVSKVFEFRADGYEIGLEVNVSGLGSEVTGISVSWTSVLVAHKPQGYRSRGVEGLALQGRKLKREQPTDPSRPISLVGDVRWVGVGDEYFLAAVAPARERVGDARFMRLAGEPAAVEGTLFLSVPGGRTVEENLVLYVGPKDVDELGRVGHGFQRAVDFGWFSMLALAALWLLQKLHGVSGNYGIDIILLTAMIKIAFVPLTHKSTKSMREMQKLQPLMLQLKEKYKDDRERLNREMMALYKRHGVNPLGGCLPMLLQFPVFIALYQVLGHSIQLRHAPFALWIKDLAAHECYLPGQEASGCNLLSLGGLPVPGLVILMGLSMIVQQWLTPTTAGTDPTQQRMMMVLLPIVFTVMFVNFPAGLVLYWLMNNILTVAQQWVTNRYVKD